MREDIHHFNREVTDPETYNQNNRLMELVVQKIKL